MDIRYAQLVVLGNISICFGCDHNEDGSCNGNVPNSCMEHLKQCGRVISAHFSKQVESLHAENERLKCCGNCVNHNDPCYPKPRGSANRCGEWEEIK